LKKFVLSDMVSTEQVTSMRTKASKNPRDSQEDTFFSSSQIKKTMRFASSKSYPEESWIFETCNMWKIDLLLPSLMKKTASSLLRQNQSWILLSMHTGIRCWRLCSKPWVHARISLC